MFLIILKDAHTDTPQRQTIVSRSNQPSSAICGIDAARAVSAKMISVAVLSSPASACFSSLSFSLLSLFSFRSTKSASAHTPQRHPSRSPARPDPPFAQACEGGAVWRAREPLWAALWPAKAQVFSLQAGPAYLLLLLPPPVLARLTQRARAHCLGSRAPACGRTTRAKGDG